MEIKHTVKNKGSEKHILRIDKSEERKLDNFDKCISSLPIDVQKINKINK